MGRGGHPGHRALRDATDREVLRRQVVSTPLLFFGVACVPGDLGGLVDLISARASKPSDEIREGIRHTRGKFPILSLEESERRGCLEP